jgi:hypothetical protein
LNDINPSVRKAAGLDVHEKELLSPEKKQTFTRCPRYTTPAKTGPLKAESYKRNSTVSLNDLSPSEVHDRAGFADVRELLFAVVCDGDLTRMTETTSYLTWLEEWFFYFEMTYGHSANRLCDYERSYNLSQSRLRGVYLRKLEMVILMRKTWPLYATHKEDVMLRKEAWNEIFAIIEGDRIVMHDNTDAARLMKSSDSEMQRATWSKYYSGCVGKGGIACQLCGWTVTLELCTGAIDDTAYIDKVQILRMQDEFAKNDPTSDKPFTNVFDKGYRCILAALEQGFQLCMQPTFAQSKRNSAQTVFYIQLVLPLFDLGMKGPFAKPSCRGWLSEVAHIISRGIWICNVIYGLLGAFRSTSCMMQCINDDCFNVKFTFE